MNWRREGSLAGPVALITFRSGTLFLVLAVVLAVGECRWGPKGRSGGAACPYRLVESTFNAQIAR